MSKRICFLGVLFGIALAAACSSSSPTGGNTPSTRRSGSDSGGASGSTSGSSSGSSPGPARAHRPEAPAGLWSESPAPLVSTAAPTRRTFRPCAAPSVRAAVSSSTARLPLTARIRQPQSAAACTWPRPPMRAVGRAVLASRLAEGWSAWRPARRTVSCSAKPLRTAPRVRPATQDRWGLRSAACRMRAVAPALRAGHD